MDIKSFIFLNFFYLLVLYFNPLVEGDGLHGLCANPECSIPVSRGITILRYSSPDDSRISVEPNEEVQIFVKEYGPKKDLYGIIVKGHRGYISKNFIRETNLFVKELVPALIEFKIPVSVTDSYTVSNHLHVSSNVPQPNVVSQTVQYTHTSGNLMSSVSNNFQQQPDFINSAPQQQQDLVNFPSSSFQQQQGFINSAPSDSQQQQGFVNSPSSSFQQQQNFINSAPSGFQPQQDFYTPSSIFQQQQDFINSAPSGFQPQQDFAPSSSFHQQQDLAPNGIGENQEYNSLYTANPSSNLHLQSQFSNVPEQSSHFHLPSDNVLNSYEMTGMQSQGILPSSIHSPDVHSPSYQNFPNDPAMIPSYENSLSGSSGSENYNPNVASSSQNFQNLHQHSAYEKDFNSPYAQGIDPSMYSNDYMDEDYSKTMAMLSRMNIENSDTYAHQESHFHPSSQNIERGFGFNEPEFISSQSQYHSIESSGTSFVGPTSHLEENTIANSDSLQKFSDRVLSENINTLPSENVIVEESDMKPINEDSSVEENEESELFFEDNSTDEEDEDDDENDEEIDSLGAGEMIPSTKILDNTESHLNMQSQSASQINLKTSEGILNIQSSREDSIHDSSALNTLSKESSTVTQKDHASSKISTDINSLPLGMNSVDAHSVLESSMSESVRKTESIDKLNSEQNNLDKTVSFDAINPILSNLELPQEKVDAPKAFSEDLTGNLDRNNNDASSAETNAYIKEHTTPKISDFFVENEKRAEVEQILSPMDIDGLGEDLTTYQGRNLKGEYGTTDDTLSDSEGSNDENNTQSDPDSHSSYRNWFDALKAAMDFVISWIPEPLYSVLMDLQKQDISPRVPVFTTLCGFTCIFLIVSLFYIQNRSKESRLSALLADAEKKNYTLSAMNVILEEKIETIQSEVASLQSSLAEEKSLSENLRMEFENQAEELENAKAELESCLEVIDALKEKENEYLTLVNDYEKEKEYYTEHKESLDKIMKDQENSIESLTDQLEESENKVQELEKEKEEFLLLKTAYEDKLAQFDQNCKQLLQEAEVWNMRVTELTENVNSEVAIKEELMASLKAKEEEIETLKELVETFKVFDDIEDPVEQAKTKEEKLQSLLNSVMITNQLKKEEEKSKLLDEQLQQEKTKILDMEVEILDAKSEIDKLKLNYNQALQDKAEAQTKLEVLTNYFKDKEIQLQRQLGAQEADRQKKEQNVNSAERRILLIEQENASYKSQVASMKQEMEETERTLRSQIAAQEKKAHENWIAARAAERNLENMKQEVTQLRQRLTLLEREQESWSNASRDEIIRPVPKRIPGVNEESGSQETSDRGMFPPPHLHDRLPLPPMMLPPDRPLPPLPPHPHLPPMFLPPPPPMERHFRPQPWHMPPDHSSDYRTTPPDFIAGRETTPPRGRPTMGDSDAPNTSSPMTTDTRDSRNSTPPHLLPDFHDIPPQPGRPYYPPPMGRPRFPMHPSYRRDAGPEHKRLDNQNESNLRGPPQPPPSEQWQHSRV